MTDDLKASYARCQSIARRAAGNFYYSFLLLSREKRRAMCALYAFLRHTDDLGDSADPVETRRVELAAWRQSLAAACEGRFDSPILPALVDTVSRYSIPREYLDECIDGVEMDLTDRTYQSFADLEGYCYKVASVVGLACIHIWGFRDRAAIAPAGRLGVAFQLTNILRDLQEDALRGRVYLPQEDLRRFGYSRQDVLAGNRNAPFKALMAFEIARAENLYREAHALEPMLARDSRAAFRAMVGIYRGLLEEIKRRDGDVFSARVSLSAWRKASLALRSVFSPAPVESVGPTGAARR
jgi:15-cis-phytoene synthase